MYLSSGVAASSSELVGGVRSTVQSPRCDAPRSQRREADLSANEYASQRTAQSG